MPNAPKTCQAALVTALKGPIVVDEVIVPQELEPGAMLVKTEVASICASDIHVWDGHSGRMQDECPFIPGHEMVGRIIDSAGAGTDSVGQPLKEGDRIIWAPASCGKCYWCTITRQFTICPNRRPVFASARRFPYLVGGFSEYCYVYPTAGKIKVPEGVKSEWASGASCAMRTAIHGFGLLGQVHDYDTVVIQGSGPVGLYATAIAAAAGAAQVITIGAPKARLDTALRWGAKHVLSVESMNAKERRAAVYELTGGRGANVVVEASGVKAAFPEGLGLVCRGGRYLVIGQTSDWEVPTSPSDLVVRQINIIGSMSGDTSDYWKAMQFIEHHRDKIDFDAMMTTRFPLSRLNEAYAAMARWEEIKPVVLPHA